VIKEEKYVIGKDGGFYHYGEIHGNQCYWIYS